jgi:hypothetical protein
MLTVKTCPVKPDSPANLAVCGEAEAGSHQQRHGSCRPRDPHAPCAVGPYLPRTHRQGAST